MQSRVMLLEEKPRLQLSANIAFEATVNGHPLSKCFERHAPRERKSLLASRPTEFPTAFSLLLPFIVPGLHDLRCGMRYCLSKRQVIGR